MGSHDHPRYPNTPDGRYFMMRGRLWRRSDPDLEEDVRRALVSELMSARRAVCEAKGDIEAMRHARARVDQSKTALGERGPVWWTDGSPDYNRKLAENTPYADWASAKSIQL